MGCVRGRGGGVRGGLAAGAAGLGDALAAAGLWLHRRGPGEGVPLLGTTGLVIHLIPLLRLHRALDYSRLMPFLVGGTLGVPVGSWLLGIADPAVFRAGVGGFLVIYSLVFLFRPPQGGFAAGGRAADGAIGLVGGVLGGLAGLSGIVPTVWSALRGWSRAEQRGIFQPFILAMHGMALAWLAWGGMVDARTAINFLWCLPGIAAGSWLGLKLYGRLDDKQFQRIVLVLLLVLGAILLI